jgi:diguanylate cyclase (GGDEF)-like protein/PAS domain S-box-containing protein
MNPGRTIAEEELSGELTALISTLRDADLRLQELTAGEVDTVTDHHGRSFLLRHAQDELRSNEAAKQAAILNALPACIALLDSQGNIVTVNEAWRRFAGDNDLALPDYGIGRNYLVICDRVRGRDSAEAQRVAQGIRSVLDGKAKYFSVEYACHSPAEQRWFLLTVTALTDGCVHGVVVMHLDITERMDGEESLRRIAAGMDATDDSICLVDRASMRFIHVNDAACRMHKLTREQLLAQGPAELLAQSRPELEQSYDALIAEGEQPLEIYRQAPDGSYVWVEVRRHAYRSGGRWTIIVLVRDITERKRADKRISQLNRLYAVLSGINTLIVRVRDRDELFREACRVAVEVGAFGMAWIGVINSQTQEGKVVGSYGAKKGFLKKVTFTARDGLPHSENPASRALRHSKAVICNDIAADASLVLVRDDLLAQGHRSVGCFPLSVAGRTEAVLVLYAGEPDIFDEGEMRLLTELATDISFALDHIEKEERLHYLAYYDELTGLANRSLFLERIGQYIRGAVSGKHGLAVFLIDLERFKNVNFSLGRQVGDALLRQVGDWLMRYVGDVNLVARVGGDHFAVILPKVNLIENVPGLIEKALKAFLAHPFRLNDAIFRSAARVGVAISPDDGVDADTLFKNAEAALNEAKVRGHRYLCYSQNMMASAAGNLTLENQLRQALENSEFVLHYQPKLDATTGKLTGAEALIRWNDPRTGLVPPGRFIPILEESGLIFDVGRWAFRTAIEDYLHWQAAGLTAVRIAVNVSPLQLCHREFIGEITKALCIDPQAADGLELEITESVIMEDVKHSIESLQAIRALGVHVAIDDFGTGFSSLSYLSKLPVDSLKIDRSFVTDMTKGPEGLALVSTIINLGHSLKLKVVAEGVETEEQSRLLRSMSCDEFQGFLFGKPVPREIFEARYLGLTSVSSSAVTAPHSRHQLD